MELKLGADVLTLVIPVELKLDEEMLDVVGYLKLELEPKLEVRLELDELVLEGEMEPTLEADVGIAEDEPIFEAAVDVAEDELAFEDERLSPVEEELAGVTLLELKAELEREEEDVAVEELGLVEEGVPELGELDDEIVEEGLPRLDDELDTLTAFDAVDPVRLPALLELDEEELETTMFGFIYKLK